MHGVGRATGAISIVNAMLEGRGCAAAITLPVEAEVSLERASPSAAGRIDLDPSCDTPLARSALLASLRRYLPGVECDAHLSVRSSIPAGRGLKSSSAVAGAILRAVRVASGQAGDSPLEEAHLVEEIGRSSGYSSTGGLDDALAALNGGIVVSDNRESRVLLRTDPDPDWRALLWIPGSTHPPTPTLAAAFREQEQDGREAARLALEGRFLEAMERNTIGVERALGTSIAPLREELRRQGALASGVTGAGPAVAVVVRVRHMRSVARAMPRGGGTLVAAGFLPRGRETDP